MMMFEYVLYKGKQVYHYLFIRTVPKKKDKMYILAEVSMRDLRYIGK